MKNRRSYFWGMLLVLVGGWFLALQIVPGLQSWVETHLSWPYQIIAIGALMFLIGLVTWTPGMVIPACIVAGIGGILLYQNTNNDYSSWAYAWALIPGFAGIGTVLAGIMSKNARNMVVGGLWQVLGSLVLFGIFGSFLGGQKLLGVYWPVGIILAGLLVVITAIFRKR